MAHPCLHGADTEAFKGLSVLVGQMISLGASNLVGQAIASDPRPRALVRSQLHANVRDVFNGYGLQIRSPQSLEGPESPKVLPPAGCYPAPAQRPHTP